MGGYMKMAQKAKEEMEKPRKQRLTPGDYQATLVDIKLDMGTSIPQPWIEQQISLRFETEDGVTFQGIELDPLTNNKGEVKGKYIAWFVIPQLEILECPLPGEGESDELSDIVQAAQTFVLSKAKELIGSVYEINVQAEKDANGEPKINPNTGVAYTRTKMNHKVADADDVAKPEADNTNGANAASDVDEDEVPF